MTMLPLWKRWLSHVFPIPVRRVATSVHPDLAVALVRGRYQLSTPHAIYSFEDPGVPVAPGQLLDVFIESADGGDAPTPAEPAASGAE